MPDVALSWEQAAGLAAALAVLAATLHVFGTRARATPAPTRAGRAAPFALETAMIAGLYALWQLAGSLSVMGKQGALARARWIEHTELSLGLPSEARLQDVVTANPVVAQAANIYYATMHFGVLFVFLLWLFVRHRDRYRPVRRVLALTTLACLLIQFVPVAPPRMLPGFTDTALEYGQSVYGAGFDSLSAMPSVHVAWASLVAVTVWRLGSPAGRWLGPLHLVLTVVVVVSTANHFWADGLVAIAVLAVCFGLERAGTRAALALRARWQARRAVPAHVEPTIPVPAGVEAG